MRCRTGAASVLRLIPIILVLSLFCSGCAELSTTARIMNIAFIELFRLPIYVMKLPFQILQSLGPALQAAMRTAGNMAPLLLFIENKTPGEKLYASIEEPLDIQVERAFKERQGIPLLPLMEEEMHNEGAKRFLLVDARIVGDPRLRSALLSSLKGGNSRVKCLPVDGVSIFSQPGRFLSICERMRVRGDALFALTAFNEDLSTLTGAAAGSIPSDMSDRVFIRHWNRLWAIPEDRARSAG